jgi:signal peptidase II
MQRKFFSTGLNWLWVSVVVILLDRITKMLALKHLTLYQPLEVFPFFNLTLAYNKGAAFSFLNSASGWQVWFFAVIAIVISLGLLIWLQRLSYKQYWLCIALTLIIGGALGNLWDRIHYEHVIDFIELYVSNWHWPAFNIADSAICIGAVMLFIEMFFVKKESKGHP